MPYVVAFNGNRDRYQLPWALAEDDALAAFVTDRYAPDWRAKLPGPVGAKARARHCPGITSARVQTDPLAPLPRTHRTNRSGHSQQALARLAQRTVTAARRTDAGLLLYAEEAALVFAREEMQAHRKGVFLPWPLSGAVATDPLGPAEPALGDVEKACRAADLVICPSEHVARSLPEIGVDASKVRVVPYGSSTLDVPVDSATRSGEVCRFVFAGSSEARSGLPHLLAAWEALAMPRSELHLICDALNGSERTHRMNNVVVHAGLRESEVIELLQDAHVYVQPSLYEVGKTRLPDALGLGAYVVASTHTVLPDLNPPEHVGVVVDAGDRLRLGGALSEARERFEDGAIEPGAIRDFAWKLSWPAFRAGVRQACAGVRPATTSNPSACVVS
ncbi:MAG: glycosyltransferase [Opitutales bacterium]